MLLNNKHYYNLPPEERKNLWKHYKKVYPNMGYTDMVKHFNDEVENYQFGGRTDYFDSDVKKYKFGGETSGSTNIIKNYMGSDENYATMNVDRGNIGGEAWLDTQSKKIYPYLNLNKDIGKNKNTNINFSLPIPVKGNNTFSIGITKTFADGGKVTFSTDGEKHVVYKKQSPTGMGKGKEGHIMVNHPTKDKGKWDTIDLTEKANAKTVAQGIAATKKWHRENPMEKYAIGGKTDKYVAEPSTTATRFRKDKPIFRSESPRESEPMFNANNWILQHMEPFSSIKDAYGIYDAAKRGDKADLNKTILSQMIPFVNYSDIELPKKVKEAVNRSEQENKDIILKRNKKANGGLIKKYQEGGETDNLPQIKNYTAETDATTVMSPNIYTNKLTLAKQEKKETPKEIFKPTTPNLLAKGLIDNYPERYGKFTVKQFGNMLDSIAEVETKNKNIKQKEGGPGRGYYQLENTTIPTAINRYNNYRKTLKQNQNIDLPKIKTPANNDARNLTKDEQAALSLANMGAAYKNKFDKNKNAIPLDPTHTMESWLAYHWAGKNKAKEDRKKHWNETFPEAARPLSKKKK